MLALDGIRILDLSRLLPGPWATMLLADFGADVIKLELPGPGDYSRWSPPFVGDESAYYLTLNRNKRSLVLDIADERGRRVLEELVARADVLVHSFRAGAPERYGLDYETVSALNPRLVYCAVTGYGQDGPYRDLAGHDANVLAFTGMFRAHLEPPPRLSNFQLADFAAASQAAIAIPLALLARERTGHGQHVDVSMFDAVFGWMHIAVLDRFASLVNGRDMSGEMVVPWGCSPRYAFYETADAHWVFVGLLETHFFERFCHAVGRADMIRSEESVLDRLTDHGEHADTLRRELEAIFRGRTQAEWVAELASLGIPCSPVNELEDALDDPHAVHRGLVTTVWHPELGELPQLGIPIKLRDTPGEIRMPPPRYGEHGPEILAELGHGQAEIDALVAAGVLKTPAHRPHPTELRK